MGQNLKFFTSKLARRFFGMFVIGALIPTIALAVISYYRVTQQLNDQALNRLRQSTKAHALSIYERLLLADYQLQNVQSILFNSKSTILTTLPSNITDQNTKLFNSLALLRDNKIAFSWGNGVSNINQEMVRKMSVATDGAQVVALDGGGPWPNVAIIRKMNGHGISESYLIAIIDPSFLWGLSQGTSLPPASEFSVWDSQGRSLFCSFGFPIVMDQSLSQSLKERTGAQSEQVIQNEPYYAFSWSAFLQARFNTSSWTVMVMEPRDYILQPLRSFRTVFLSIIALSLVIVAYLTSRAIRKSLIPIEALMHGAHQVATGVFSNPVIVKSKDEFQDLADAFNAMTNELDTQFKLLSVRSDLDHAILSVLDVDQIISTALDHSNSFISYSVMAISVLEAENPLGGLSHIREGEPPIGSPRIEPFQLSGEERTACLGIHNWLRIDADKITPSFLRALDRPDIRYFIVFPVRIQNRLFAMVSLGINANTKCGQKDLEQMRGLSDQLAIAFANSDLLKELKELNIGTLYALARTVDAKSSWTAGHSMRVTQLAIDIAKVLGLSQELRDDLQRAALLHDIGKIGIPQSIIDKPGKLTDEEYNIIKRHPSIGAGILNPIRAYANIIPIVEEHHERYDGKGYPFGKSGEQIHPSARIMALADTFDAMVSDRPYRAGLAEEQAIAIIRKEAGHQFDPGVVEAFNQVIGGRKGAVLLEALPEFSCSPLTMPSSTSFPITAHSHSEQEGKLC
jgi:putative nucleotidyltransferase with HDIG domain